MNDKLLGYLEATRQLPSAPVLMIKLIECFRQPNHDIDEIVSLMAFDPSITAEVLKCCNSSFFGSEEPVVDISEAVFRLGFYEVYRVSVAMFGQQTMAAKHLQKIIDVDGLWRHCAITAVTSGAIARELEETEGLAFTAGLLHDVGKMVLASAEGAHYPEIWRATGNTGREAATAEKYAFGFDHAEIGATLLARWGMPSVIYEPVMRHHHTTWPKPYERLSAIVSLGNLMAHCIDGVPAATCCALPEAINALEILGLTHDDMPALVTQAQNDMKRLKRLIPAKQDSAPLRADMNLAMA
ncbi:MAG TPA: HDOD domain-containing protein [Dongiaceae bacterium]|jgi:putative nucleotidyltransferase with HDIG domain|nr:HDOD domain-containing protein [Dongiaceae bacterium]